MPEIKQRATAYKMRIGDILKGNPVIENERMNFLELDGREVLRVNVVANVIEKYESPGLSGIEGQADKKKYMALTIDDASGQIRIKVFGDDVDRFKEITPGNTIMIIGMVRYYNNELYIAPEIIKIQDPRYLLVRKLELEKEKPKEINKDELKETRGQIIEMIKKAENEGGIDTDKIIMEIKASPEIINQEIIKLIEDGLAYEPRPGKLRYLG